MGIQIRQLTEQDTQNYVSLVHSAYASNLAFKIHFQAGNVSIDQAKRHVSSNGVYGLFQSDQLISSLSIRYPWGIQPGPYRWPHLGWFATAPESKQRGFGQQLFQWVEQKILIDTLHAPAVSLGTAAEHPWLQRLYENYGFSVTETIELTSDHLTVFMLKILIPELYYTEPKKVIQ